MYILLDSNVSDFTGVSVSRLEYITCVLVVTILLAFQFRLLGLFYQSLI